MEEGPELRAFARLVDALEPWVGQVVIIGGRCHRLYRHHLWAQEIDHAPLITGDVDVALPARLSVKKKDVHERLTERGFTEEFLGNDVPPVTHYMLGEPTGRFYVEFLTALTGSPHDRKKRPRTTLEVGGVVTQQLRHLDLLLEQPWWVEFPVGESAVQAQVANAASFIAQKLLIHGKRSVDDRAKDILYIHDTLKVFGPNLFRLRDIWQGQLKTRLPSRTVRKVEQSSGDLFGEVTDDIRGGALVAADRALSPGRVRDLCRAGLEEVFG